GRFCMNSAFRDIILLKEFKLAKAVVIALITLMIGFAIFAFAGVIHLAPKPLKIWGAVVGGLVFGIGMVLAAGCASGTTYRVGEGMIGSLIAGIGLTFLLLFTSGYGQTSPETSNVSVMSTIFFYLVVFFYVNKDSIKNQSIKNR
ncbi:unnamed protein product, partial [marine sediment metagenome]